MPWCPQCRAEYRAGVTTCAVCGVALVAELPPAERRAIVLPRPLAGIVADAAAALRYTLSALRLLRRNPSLLILPLAFTVFNVVEIQAGRYMTYRHTAWGREVAREIQNREGLLPMIGDRVSLRLRWREGVQRFAYPIPGVGLYGTVEFAFSAQRPTGTHAEPSIAREVIPTVLVGLAFTVLAALLLAGYYGVAAGAVGAGAASWGRFGQHMKRHWLRFFLLALIFIALIGGPSYLSFALLYVPFLLSASSWWWAWITPIITFLLALPLYAVAAEDVSVKEGIRRSVIITATSIVTGLVLLAALALLEAAVLAPLSAAAEHFAGPGKLTDLAALQLASIPWQLVEHLWQAFLGVLLCLAMFYWYGEASKRFRVEAAPVPAEEPATPPLESLG